METPLFLRAIVDEFERKSLEMGIEPVITRVSDPVEGESGVHPQKRAVDIRDEHNGRRTYTPAQRDLLIDYFNTKYRRRDGRPTVVWHSFKGAPHHFHIQVAASMSTYLINSQKKTFSAPPDSPLKPV